MDEKDDDFEWLPNPKQSELIGLPITRAQIDGWLAMMDQLEGVLKGKRLISSQILSFIGDKHKQDFGLNVKKVLDDPPADLLNIERIMKEGIDAKYLEPEKKKAVLDLDMVINAARIFDGPFAISYAARFN